MVGAMPFDSCNLITLAPLTDAKSPVSASDSRLRFGRFPLEGVEGSCSGTECEMHAARAIKPWRMVMYTEATLDGYIKRHRRLEEEY
jgi:hypothetical protein